MHLHLRRRRTHLAVRCSLSPFMSRFNFRSCHGIIRQPAWIVQPAKWLRVYFMVGADNVPSTAHGYYRLATSPALCRGRGLRPQLEVRPMAAAVYLRWLKLGYEHFTEKVAQQFKAIDRPQGNQRCAIDDDWPCGRLCGHWRYHSLALLSSHQTALNGACRVRTETLYAVCRSPFDIPA